LSGGAVCHLCREVASSEAEMSYALEGRFATLERGGDVLPARGEIRYPRARRRCGAQSRVSMGALERDGDHPAGPRGVRMGRMLGFFDSFPFFQIGRRPWAFVGSVA